MQEIVFVTHNRGKVFAAQKYFDGIRLVTFDYELDEPHSDDLKTIATAKVRQAYALVGKPCFALDTGFYIEELTFADDDRGNRKPPRYRRLGQLHSGICRLV